MGSVLNLYRFLSVPSEIAVLLVAALLIASLEFSLGGSPLRSDFAVLKYLEILNQKKIFFVSFFLKKLKSFLRSSKD